MSDYEVLHGMVNNGAANVEMFCGGFAYVLDRLHGIAREKARDYENGCYKGGKDLATARVWYKAAKHIKNCLEEMPDKKGVPE